MSYVSIHLLMNNLVRDLPWLHKCVSALDVTDVITTRQDFTEYIRNVAKQYDNEFELSSVPDITNGSPVQDARKAPLDFAINEARQRQQEQPIIGETHQINDEIEK